MLQAMGYNGTHMAYNLGWAILAALTDCLAIHSTQVIIIFPNYEMILKECIAYLTFFHIFSCHQQPAKFHQLDSTKAWFIYQSKQQ